jgi:hypothetical protein
MALEVPDAPELEGFAVFRSRRVEDGRDRYRLHLGYFESREDAQRALPAVRARYPAAWIALAPPDSMGSLDDTNVAQFKFIRQNKAQTPTRPHIPAHEPEPIKATPVKATLVAPRSGQMSAAPRRSAPLTQTVNRVPMTPAQVLQLLESAPRAARPATAPAKPHSEPAAGTFAPGQKFAVQLVWATTPVHTGKVPQLAIFEAYTLYSVQVERAGRRWYGLRLGFFKDPLSARQVALYARSDFSAAAVVPVSDRECDKASTVAAQAQTVPTFSANDAGPKPTDEIVLTPDGTETHQKPKGAQAQPAPSRAATRNGAAQQAAAAKRLGKRRPDKSAEELLEELGADELSIQNSPAHQEDTSESGVRHLSVSVMKSRSPLARLFGRVARRREQ